MNISLDNQAWYKKKVKLIHWNERLHAETKKLADNMAKAFYYIEDQHNLGHIDENYLPKFIKNGRRSKSSSSLNRNEKSSSCRNENSS